MLTQQIIWHALQLVYHMETPCQGYYGDKHVGTQLSSVQGLAARTKVMDMGRRSVDLAKQALSSVHSRVAAAVQPIIIVAFPDQEVRHRANLAPCGRLQDSKCVATMTASDWICCWIHVEALWHAVELISTFEIGRWLGQ